jgi:hypothetical protein
MSAWFVTTAHIFDVGNHGKYKPVLLVVVASAKRGEVLMLIVPIPFPFKATVWIISSILSLTRYAYL